MACGRGGVAVLLLAWFVAVAAQNGGYEESEMASGEDYADEVDYIDEEDPFWSELASRVRERIDTPGLLKARRWGNIANGVLLGATGPVTLVVSLLSARLSNAILSVYLTGLGAVLAGLELNMNPIAPWVVENVQYLTKPHGRTALLAFAGGLAWAFGKAGLLPAVLTCFNAIFNANFRRIVSFIEDDGRGTRFGEEDGGAFATDEGVLPEPTEEPLAEPETPRRAVYTKPAPRAQPAPAEAPPARAHPDPLPETHLETDPDLGSDLEQELSPESGAAAGAGAAAAAAAATVDEADVAAELSPEKMAELAETLELLKQAERAEAHEGHEEL